MLLLIDNYDSFTYNLAQHLSQLRCDVRVVRNDEITLDEVLALSPERVVLSPGPGRPEDAGVCLPILRQLPVLRPELPILGVCLGHQALALVHGARVVRAAQAIHGKVWPIEAADDPLFAGLPRPFLATRYHSLVVERQSLPPCLTVTAWTAEGEIMGLRHLGLPLHGVQFHPESIGTPEGLRLLANFLALEPGATG